MPGVFFSDKTQMMEFVFRMEDELKYLVSSSSLPTLYPVEYMIYEDVACQSPYTALSTLKSSRKKFIVLVVLPTKYTEVNLVDFKHQHVLTIFDMIDMLVTTQYTLDESFLTKCQKLRLEFNQKGTHVYKRWLESYVDALNKIVIENL